MHQAAPSNDRDASQRVLIPVSVWKAS
jgi:hypothetical protein